MTPEQARQKAEELYELSWRSTTSQEAESAIAAALLEAAGAWCAIKTIDDLPKKQTDRYGQYDCLVYHKGGVKPLVWNCEHVCWDDWTGDDFYCDALEPSHYMLFPEPPAIEVAP